MIKLGPVKWALLLMSSLTMLATTPISPVLPKLAEAFAHEPRADLLSRLVLTTPALFVLFGAPVAGLIADRYGRRPLALGAIALYSVAGTSAFFADSLVQILAGRALLGLGMAGVFTAATTLITDYYFGRERSQLLGLQGAAMTAGAVICLSLGGVLAEIGWQWPFLLYLLGLLAFCMVYAVIPEPERKEKVEPPPGEKKLPGIFFATLYAAALTAHVALFALPVQLPFHLLVNFGIGGVGTGLILSLATVFAAITSFNYGRIKGRLSYSTILVLLYGLTGLSFTTVGLADHIVVLAAGLCFSGAAAGLLLPVMNNWISDISAPSARARALGAFSTTMFVGQFLSPLVTTPLATPLGYADFFLVLGLFMFLTSLAIATRARALTRATANWLR